MPKRAYDARIKSEKLLKKTRTTKPNIADTRYRPLNRRIKTEGSVNE
jgi:hypothetical protein